MDEFQFIESLDSLLSNEVVDDNETTAEVAVNNNTSIPIHGQGILSGPISWGTTDWLPSRTTNNSISGGGTNVDPFGTFRSTAVNESMNPTDQGQYPHAFTPLVDNSNNTSSIRTDTNIHVEQTTSMLETNNLSSSSTTILSVEPQLGVNACTGNASVIAQSLATTVAPSGTASVCSANSRCSSNGSSRKLKDIGSSRSVGSATTGSAGTGTSSSWKRSRSRRSSTEVSDSEDDTTRRRYDRNLREQRRSRKITQQIDELRDVLAAASVRFKPDKFSTLISVVEYVKQLQARSTMLDLEHKKLLDTISRTNEMVNESYLPSSAANGVRSNIGNENVGPESFMNAHPDSTASNGNDIYNDDELVFVRNVDYRCIFDRCGMPLAVASIDGRLLDCNDEFVKLTGYERNELLPIKNQEQTSSTPADRVPSTAEPSEIPDLPTSGSRVADSSTDEKDRFDLENDPTSSRIYAEQERSGKHDDILQERTIENQVVTRNFSLFDLLNRNHMEEVFVSLSEMLKRPPKDKVCTGGISLDDHWWGNVHLNRNTHLEIRMNISLVRSPQGRAKFFDCSLTPLAV